MADITADARTLARRLTEVVNQYTDRGLDGDEGLQGLAYFYANFQLTLNEGQTLRFLQLVRECTEGILDTQRAAVIVPAHFGPVRES